MVTAPLALVAVLALTGMADSPAERYQREAAAARSAREGGDMTAYLGHVREMFALLPGHPGSRFALARALSLAGERQSAIEALRTLADQGFGYDAGADPAFAALQGDPAFIEANRRLTANRQPGGRDADSIPVGLPGRRPEGVAALADGRFLVGTWDGQVYAIAGLSLIPLGRGHGIVAGVRPDPATRTVLVCLTDEEGGRASVQRHRITDGAIVAIYPLPASRAFCNDIALTGDGGFVVTESNGGRVYRLADGRLEPLAIERLFYPNGVAVDPASGRIYIAHGGGIAVFDPEAGSASPLEVQDTVLGGIDGLVWHEGGLIAVQNVTVPSRVLRIALDARGRAAVEPLLTGSALLEGATTVAAHGGVAWVLSHTGIPTGDPPNDPILVRVPL